VDVGDTVTFTNEDTADHNAIAEDDSFRTSTFGEGESESVTISEAGSYPYFCSLHANMEGRISTTGSAPSGGGGSGGSGGSGGGGGGGSASAGGGAGDIPLIPGDPGTTGSTDPGAGATSGGSGGGGTLPLTGSDSTWLAIAGLWLLSVGVAVRAAVAGRI
jgi:LPXTG-motif cell wall-anchored protein